MSNPKVGIIMGSRSDWPTLQAAAAIRSYYILGYASTRTHSFVGGLAILAASLVLGAVCVLAVRNHRPAGQSGL